MFFLLLLKFQSILEKNNNRKAEGGADLREKVHALLLGVQKREAHVREEDLQRKAGKAGAGADVDDARAGERKPQRRSGGVQKVLRRALVLTGDGGQVHNAVFLLKQVVIDAKTLQRPRIAGQVHRLKAAHQGFFQHIGPHSV